MSTEQIVEAAMALPPESRAEVIRRLLTSLEQSRRDIDQAWVREVEDRIAAFEAGKIAEIDANDVLAEFGARLP